MDKAAEKKKSDKIVFTICFLLALMVWGVFGQTLRHEFVNYDDDKYVYDNPAISKGLTLTGARWALTHPHGANWHPLTSFSHMLDCQIYGLNPGGHHGTNVLLHMATVILLFLVLRQMTGSLWRSAFVAAVFAIHPLRAESVAWISERKDVLSGFFFMLTLGAYLRYVRRPFSAGRYSVIAIFFTLGLMSKAMLVTLPFVLLLLDFWPLKRLQALKIKRPIQRLVVEKIPLLLLSAAFCGITIWAQRESIVSDQKLSAPWRLGNAFCSYAIYIKQLFFPSGLAPFYPHPGARLPLWEVGVSAALLAGISWGVFAGRKKYPYLITGWCWYLGMLAPVIGIMQVGLQAHADRYTYLPQIGLAVMAAWLAADWCASLRYRRAVLSAAAVVVLVVLAVTAHKQTRHWQDCFSLWTHTLACTDSNDVAHMNLGSALGRQRQFDKAISHLEKAIAINPNFADTYYNLGVVFNQQEKFAKAIPYFEKALKRSPNYSEAHYGLGFALAETGKPDDALEHYRKALKINPDYADVHACLGALFSKQEQFEKATPHLEKALKINPALADAHYNLAMAFNQQGQLDKAILHFEKSLELNPNDAGGHCNLGAVFAKQGQVEKAIFHLEKALKINPDFPEIYNNLGILFTETGKIEKAIPYFEKALEINPNDAGTSRKLGALFAEQGNLFAGRNNFAAAIRQYEQALRINPDYIEVQNNLAWILATCPDAALRDGPRAVELARSADRLSRGTQPSILDTLAAAYAEAGQYPEAVTTARRALNLAAGQESVADGLRTRLRLYEADAPYHESRGEP